MSSLLQNAVNYLVPATGSPNIYSIHETFSATPFAVDFTQIGLNGLPFRPSGVIIDNTRGTGDLSILIPQVSYNIVCKAGASLAMQYPAPVNHSASITGLGDATVIFVDFPIMPFSSAQAAGTNIPNPLPVSGPLTNTELRASGVPVTGPATDAQMRATPIPVSVPAAVAVTGPATDAQMRATPIPVSLPAGALTAALTSSSAAGNTAAGLISASFLNSGAAAATVAGGSLPAGQIVNFEAPNGKTLNAIAYNGTGTTLIISTLG